MAERWTVQSYLKKLKCTEYFKSAFAGLSSKFTRRYFVLDFPTKQFYYTGSKGGSRKKGSYEFSEILSFDPNPKIEFLCDWKFAFEIRLKTRSYLLYSESVKTHQEWCCALAHLTEVGAVEEPPLNVPEEHKVPELPISTQSELPAPQPTEEDPLKLPESQEISQRNTVEILAAPPQRVQFAANPEPILPAKFTQCEDISTIRRERLHKEPPPQEVPGPFAVLNGPLPVSFNENSSITDILKDMEELSSVPQPQAQLPRYELSKEAADDWGLPVDPSRSQLSSSSFYHKRPLDQPSDNILDDWD